MKAHTNMNEDTVATMMRMDISRIRFRTIVEAVKLMSTSRKTTIISWTTMRILAALPPAFTAYNVTTDLKGNVILPVDAMLGSRINIDTGFCYIWVIFAPLATEHTCDSNCVPDCDEEFDDPSPEAYAFQMSEGVFLGVHSIIMLYQP